MGATQKISLSAPEGIIISLETNFKPSAINCKIPSILPRKVDLLSAASLARNLRSTNMVTAASIAANVKPGNTATLNNSVWIMNFRIGRVRVGSTIIDKNRYGVRTSPLTGGSGHKIIL